MLIFQSVGLLGLVFLLILDIFFIVAVYNSAKKRGRAATGWTILSLFATPILCLLAIHVLGETKEKWEERIVEEELLRIRVKEEFDKD